MTQPLPRIAGLTLLLWLLVAIADLAAQPAAAAEPASGPQGQAVVEQMVAMLDTVPSVSAQLRHRVDLMGRSLLGTGHYAQQGRGPNRQFRHQLELRTRLFATSVEQVCDGQRIWIHSHRDGHEHLAVVELQRLQQARAKVDSPPVDPRHWLGLGGLPKLAWNLHLSFEFGKVSAGRLDDLTVWSVEGVWRRERLAQMLPDQAEAILNAGEADLQQLTPNIPHRVVLHLGSDDLFPYRIEYWRTDTGGEGEQLKPIQKLMAVMECYEVQLGAPIEATRFNYRPPEKLVPADRTKEWLERLGLEDPPPAEASRRGRPRR